MPNFLSTGLGERFCALWRMLHLASAAAHDKREGGQDRVTPRMQRGAELSSSSSLRVCHGAGQQTSQVAARAGVLRGLAEAWASAPLPDRARCLHGTAIRHGYTARLSAQRSPLHGSFPCTRPAAAPLSSVHDTAPAPSFLRRPAPCTARIPAPSSLHSTALSLHGTAPLCATQLPACSLALGVRPHRAAGQPGKSCRRSAR